MASNSNYTHMYKNPAIVHQIETEYPETTTEYMKIVMESYETFCLKQSNYGPSNISVGTSVRSEDDIKLSLSGLFFRLNDKISRIKQLVVLGKQDNVGEAVDDTFQDLGVYAIIAQIVKRGKWGK
jgi:hypothetical protein